MSESKKAGYPPSLRFVGVYRKCFIGPATRMRDVIRASADRSFCSKVHNIEYQWRMYRDRRMEAPWRLPRAVPYTTNEIALRSCWLQRQPVSIAGYRQFLTYQAFNMDLHSFNRRIDIACGSTRTGLFAEDVPRFRRQTEFDPDVGVSYMSQNRITEIKMRREPPLFERISGPTQIVQDMMEIGNNEVS